MLKNFQRSKYYYDGGGEDENETFTVHERVQKCQKIIETLRGITGRGKQFCVSGPNSIKKQIGVSQQSHGSFGNVYKVDYKGLKFVIKESKIVNEVNEVNKVNEVNEVNEVLIDELFICMKMSELVEKRICPNMPLLYDFSYCKTCDLKSCLELASELFDGSMHELFETITLSDDLLYNFLYQAMHSIACAQHIYGLSQGDIKLQNFLFKKIRPGGFWLYKFRGTDYYVPNLGYAIALNAFGSADMLREKYTTNNKLGLRRVHIMNGRVNLFHTKKGVEFDAKGLPSLVVNDDKNGGTQYFIKGMDLEPEIKVDVENFDKFPPDEFLQDNIMLLKIFSGWTTSFNSSIEKYLKKNGDHLYSITKLMKIIFSPMYSKMPKAARIIDTFVSN